MRKNWNALETLKHSRHDWLNKLQLIKGNLALNHIDRVNQIIDEIIMNAKHESNLTNLKTEDFASLLMTFNWENHNYLIEYEILGQIKDLSTYDASLTNWCNEFFLKLDEAVKTNIDNHLSISIDLMQQMPCFFFDFSGIIQDKEVILNWIENHDESPMIKVENLQVHTNEMALVIKLT